MKYNALLLAGFLPIIAAQSAVSGAAKPTGFIPGEKPTAKWGNSTNVAGPTGAAESLTPSGSSALPSGNVPNPYVGLNSKSSTEGLGIKAESASSEVSSSTASHVPYAPGAGVHFANSTGASFDNVLVYPTGTGASSGFAKPTNSPQGTVTGTGHLPYTSGVAFLNATAGSDDGVVVKSVLPTGAGVSSGFAKPTNSLSGTAAGTGHLPYTSGAPFANTTAGANGGVNANSVPGTGVSSGFAKPTNSIPGTAAGTGHLPYKSGAPFANATTDGNGGVNANSILPTGTGISSGFAKPSAISNFTRPAENATRPATTTGRLPFTSSKGLYFGNSTSSGLASATDDSSLNVASATGILSTGVSSGFPVQTAPAGFTDTFVVRPTGFLTGVTAPASQATTIPSGKPLWTNSTSISKAPSSTFIPGTGVASIPTTISKADASSFTIKLNETSPTIISSSASRLPTLSAIPPYSNSTSSAIKSAAPTTFGTVTVPSTAISSSAAPGSTETPVAEYYQCGGLNWSGSKTCSSGLTCKEYNPYYHQCVRE